MPDLGMDPLARSSGARHSASRDMAGRARQRALEELAARAALTGDRGAALPGAADQLTRRTRIGDYSLAGDESGWKAWWDEIPDAARDRAAALGAAGGRQFDEAMRKKRGSPGEVRYGVVDQGRVVDDYEAIKARNEARRAALYKGALDRVGRGVEQGPWGRVSSTGMSGGGGYAKAY